MVSGEPSRALSKEGTLTAARDMRYPDLTDMILQNGPIDQGSYEL